MYYFAPNHALLIISREFPLFLENWGRPLGPSLLSPIPLRGPVLRALRLKIIKEPSVVIFYLSAPSLLVIESLVPISPWPGEDCNVTVPSRHSR